MTMNTTETKKLNPVYAILVGRHNKAAIITTMIQPGVYNNGARYIREFNTLKKEFDIPMNEEIGRLQYMQTMYAIATELVKQAVNAGRNVNLYTIDDIDIKSKLFFKMMRNYQEVDADEIDRIIGSNRVWTDVEKAEIKEAILDYFEQLQLAMEKDIRVSTYKVSEHNIIRLNVPEGVELAEGDILDFVNGKAKNGVSVSGWNSFSRTKAVVHVNQKASGTVFFLDYRTKRPTSNKPNSIHDAVMAHISAAWSMCPAVEQGEIKEATGEALFVA